MAVQIGAKPDSGFDDPLGMLKDCHRRIEHFLSILCAVVERAQQQTLTDEEIVAIQSALSYFRVGGQRHTADEEESLFPRLIAVGGLRSWTSSNTIMQKPITCTPKSRDSTSLGFPPSLCLNPNLTVCSRPPIAFATFIRRIFR